MYSTLQYTKYAVTNEWMKKGKTTVREGEWWIGLEHRGCLGQQKSLHIIIMIDTFVKPLECTRRVKCNANYEIWVLMTCQWRFLDCNKRTILGQWFLDTCSRCSVDSIFIKWPWSSVKRNLIIQVLKTSKKYRLLTF